MQKGSVLAADEERDLALVKLVGKEYQYIPVGTVSGVHIGEDVVAVGAPRHTAMEFNKRSYNCCKVPKSRFPQGIAPC